MPALSTRRVGLAALIARARAAHAAVSGEPGTALLRAFEAGEALLAIKAQLRHGAWAASLRETRIPPSTARLYMQLARARARIEAAGCTSIREARRLLSGTRPRAGRPPGSGRRRAEGAAAEARYQAGYTAGYADGYARGRADGFVHGQGARPTAAPDGRPLDGKDLRWLLKLAHPDHHDGNLRATRVTQWLTTLLREKAPRAGAR